MFSADSSVYATTRDGLYKSTDFGNSWYPVAPFVTGLITKDFVNLPTEFILEQNYPNPFNPSTTISFSVPEIEFVTLKVYDVLGNEIATLINEEKSAGSYEILFDATDLSSGIYFYRLQAGSFVETKKMVLMK
jgi:hypothetical protein